MSRLIKSHAAARKAKEHAAQLDFSQNLRDPSVWRAAADLAWLGLGSELTCIAHGALDLLPLVSWRARLTKLLVGGSVDPVQSLLAVGTVGGRILVLGQGPARCDWVVTRAPSIKHLAFRQGSSFLCAIGKLGHAASRCLAADLSVMQTTTTPCMCTTSRGSRMACLSATRPSLCALASCESTM